MPGGTPVTIELVQLIAAVVSVIVAGLGSLGGFYWLLAGKIDTLRHDVSDEIEALGERILTVERDVASYKLSAAQTFMSKASAGAALDRLTSEFTNFRSESTAGRHDLRNEVHKALSGEVAELRAEIRELRQHLIGLGRPPLG